MRRELIISNFQGVFKSKRSTSSNRKSMSNTGVNVPKAHKRATEIQKAGGKRQSRNKLFKGSGCTPPMVYKIDRAKAYQQAVAEQTKGRGYNPKNKNLPDFVDGVVTLGQLAQMILRLDRKKLTAAHAKKLKQYAADTKANGVDAKTVKGMVSKLVRVAPASVNINAEAKALLKRLVPKKKS